jgi:hypothetical protein
MNGFQGYAKMLVEAEPIQIKRPARTPARGRTLNEAEVKLAQKQASEGWTNQKIGLFHGVSARNVQQYTKGIKRGYPDGR